MHSNLLCDSLNAMGDYNEQLSCPRQNMTMMSRLQRLCRYQCVGLSYLDLKSRQWFI